MSQSYQRETAAVYQVLLMTSPYQMPCCEAYMPLRRLLYPSGALDVYDLKMRRARLRFFWEGIILPTQSKDYYTLPEDHSWRSAQEPLMV